MPLVFKIQDPVYTIMSVSPVPAHFLGSDRRDLRPNRSSFPQDTQKKHVAVPRLSVPPRRRRHLRRRDLALPDDAVDSGKLWREI